ncbi:hypothetical protein ACHQM5_030057 [Ranunculus cassubicifolius]
MANIILLFLTLVFSITISTATATATEKVYIVYMGAKPQQYHLSQSHHTNILQQVLQSSRSASESLLYSYRKSFNGFAARLTDSERDKLVGMPGVVSVFPSTTLHPRTTRSWDFLSFPSTVDRLPEVESDIIIGFIDTGIWPESESFNDDGFGPPPKHWKGTCQNLTCNNKIIGAKFYKSDQAFSSGEEMSPRDFEGHGTHTASTAAGREVKNISFYGLAGGTARGAVPAARIAVYKVCWVKNCLAHDVLAAFDDAIADGVDLISVSLGGEEVSGFAKNSVAIGAFHALQQGILTSAPAGDNGFLSLTVANGAPWILTVAASTIDRRFITNITLGNNATFMGPAINVFQTSENFYPLVYQEVESQCDPGSLDKHFAEGRIVICKPLIPFEEGASAPLLADAYGAVIVVPNEEQDVSFSYPLPATAVSVTDGGIIESYASSARNATAIIHKSKVVHDPNAPSLASFSNRGPSFNTPRILKPDISAPGVDILAAWSPKGLVSKSSGDRRSVMYNIVSGTSISSAHATGAAAYVKTFHPTWSPAAIKSALMTTASPMKTIDSTEDEFGFGVGQIDPVKAVNPGLVYDAVEADYVELLCNLNYTVEEIKIITGKNITCGMIIGTEALLNYPSMASYIEVSSPISGYFPRTVTNVGFASSTYIATISEQPLLNITVTPNILTFKSLNEKKTFTVNITGGVLQRSSVVTAWLTWSDGVHSVRSLIAVLER